MRAEDMLPDHIDERKFGDTFVRKGSVGAFISNARVFSNPKSTNEERVTAEHDIIEALPALRALGLFDIFEIKSETLRKLINKH